VVNGRPELALALTDPIRPDAAQAVAALHGLGVRSFLK
jgi:cation transport ATPase